MAGYNDALTQLKAIADKNNNVIDENDFESIAEECGLGPEDMEKLNSELSKSGMKIEASEIEDDVDKDIALTSSEEVAVDDSVRMYLKEECRMAIWMPRISS